MNLTQGYCSLSVDVETISASVLIILSRLKSETNMIQLPICLDNKGIELCMNCVKDAYPQLAYIF